MIFIILKFPAAPFENPAYATAFTEVSYLHIPLKFWKKKHSLHKLTIIHLTASQSYLFDIRMTSFLKRIKIF